MTETEDRFATWEDGGGPSAILQLKFSKMSIGLFIGPSKYFVILSNTVKVCPESVIDNAFKSKHSVFLQRKVGADKNFLEPRKTCKH